MENFNDRLSSLPSEIIQMIFSNLSLNDTIKTSILSKQWRYKWRIIPNLVFDLHDDLKAFPQSANESYDDQISKMIHKVNKVLSLHIGDIWSFQFRTHVDVFSNMDIWLQYLVLFNLEQLAIDIDLSLQKCYRIPYVVFDYQKLVILNLSRCQIELPASFEGFKNLTTLYLNHVEFVCDDAMEKLVWNCPLLYCIVIMHCSNCGIMKIHAPELRLLKIIGKFSLLNFLETPSTITYVKIGLTQFSPCNFTNLLSVFSNVEHLYLHNRTISVSSSNFCKFYFSNFLFTHTVDDSIFVCSFWQKLKDLNSVVVCIK